MSVARGVSEHHEHIDELIASHLQGWTLNRLPVGRPRDPSGRGLGVAASRRTFLEPVAVDEAVELARNFRPMIRRASSTAFSVR